jgi:hypothetical protein
MSPALAFAVAFALVACIAFASDDGDIGIALAALGALCYLNA